MLSYILTVMLCSNGSVCDVVYVDALPNKDACYAELRSHTMRSDVYTLEVRGMCMEQSIADYCEASVNPAVESAELYAECMDYYEKDGME